MDEAAPARTRSRLRADAVRLGACAFFVFAPIGVQMPFFPLWLASRGFQPDLIALLLGVAPVVRFAVNLIVPRHADRGGDARRVLLGCAILAAGAQAASGLPFGTAWIFLLSLLATAGQGPMVPLLDSIVLREVRRRLIEREKPLDYGAIRGMGSISVLLLMLAGGALASSAPTSAIIWIIAATSAVAAVAVAVFLPRQRGANGKPAKAVSSGGIANKTVLILVIAASSTVQASHAMVYTFGSIGWRRAGYADGSIGLLWACGVATEVALFIFANRIARGRSLSHTFLVAGCAIAVLRWTIMALDPGPAVLLGAQALHAGSFAATYLGAVLAISALAGESRRAQVQGWMSAANALTLAAATVACGPLWSRFGAAGYGAVAVLAAVGLFCAILAGILLRRDQPHSAGSGGKATDPS